MNAATVVSLLAACVCAHAATCTEDNIGAVFTECFTLPNGTEQAQVLQYWKDPCESGNVTLEAPKTVPCNVHCEDGKYYSTNAECEDCPPGTYSVSEAITYEGFNGTLPKDIATYCHSRSCNPWTVEHNVLTSGDNSLSPDAESSLVLIVNTGAFAKVTVQHRIECERDTASMQIYVDGHLQWGTKTTGLDFTWDTAEFYLNKGSHIVRFSYTKSRSNPVGADRAFIKSITVAGQEKSVTACSPCPLGYASSTAGSGSCSICPVGTKRGFNDPATSCIDCSDTEMSAPGSEKCEPLAECTFPKYDACEARDGGFKRKATWQQSGCISFKPEEYQDCSVCLEGYFRDQSGKCTHCPRGQYRKGDECQTCTGGMFAVPKLVFEDFATAEGVPLSMGLTQDDSLMKVTNLCTQDATSSCREKDSYGDTAWEIQKTMLNGQEMTTLSSGMGHGNSVNVELSLTVTMVTVGHIDFKYYFGGATSCSKGTFVINNKYEFSLDLARNELAQKSLGSFSELEGSDDVVFAPGQEYKLKWIFEKSCSGSVHESNLYITSLSLYGVEGGASTSCLECPKGKKCPASEPVPIACPKGQYQDKEAQSTCLPCAAGSATHSEGMISCKVCAPAVVNADQSACLATCELEDSSTGLSFDIRPIGNKLFGPLVDLDHIRRMGPTDLDINNQTSNDLYSIQRYFLKLCEIVNDDANEKELCSSGKRAYACQRLNQDLAYSMGDVPFYEVSASGINITFSDGSKCHYRNNEKVSPYPRVSHIDLTCDPSVTTLSPEMKYIREESCSYYFEMTTAFACPKCTDAMFFAEVGECDLESQQAQVTWHKNASCLGERTPTVKECKRSCTAGDFEMLWGACTSDSVQTQLWQLKQGVVCVDDNNMKPTKEGGTRDCIGSNKMVLAGIIFTCILILLFMVLCLTYRKKRMMETKYSRLAAQERDIPMSSFPHVDGADIEEQAERDAIDSD